MPLKRTTLVLDALAEAFAITAVALGVLVAVLAGALS